MVGLSTKGVQMRSYPTAKEQPHRMTRKKLRKEIFWQNYWEASYKRAERKKARKEKKND